MNNEKWDLNALYKGFDTVEFKNDLDYIVESIKNINLWVEDNLKTTKNPIEKIKYYISFENKFSDTAFRLYDYSQLVLSTDASNETAEKYCDIIETILTDLTYSQTKFAQWLGEINDIDNIINQDELLKEHKFFLKETLEQNAHTLSADEEIIISKLKTTGSSAWTRLQDNITSTLLIPIEINGKTETLPLPAIRNLAYEKSSETRKKAYEAEIEALSKIAPVSAACLNGIKGEVITVASMKKYSSPLDMTLQQSRMDKQSLDAMLCAIKNNINIFEKYFLKKAEILGHKKGLPFYDLFAPIGNVTLKYSYKQAQEIIVENFHSFSKKLGDYAEKAFSKNWIDVYPYNGKRGGAFCSNLHSIGESRILTNFDGSFNSVITLAHELGHGYHGEMLNNETYLNSDYPMPIAETASTFCETIVKNAILKNVSAEKKLVILENDIADNAQVIVDIMSRFLFEDEVFTKRKSGPLSHNELCSIMIDAQNKTYGKGLDEKYMHKYMWVCKPHYYDADYNYYNFPYAFGLLFAKGLYSIYLEKGNDFLPQYDTLLQSTGKNSLEDVAKIVDIDLHNTDFWQNSIEIVKNDINEFCR